MVAIRSRNNNIKRLKTSPGYMKWRDHQKLYKVIEGAVADAFYAHPDYLTLKGKQAAVESVTKRVIGQIINYSKKVRTMKGKDRGTKGPS